MGSRGWSSKTPDSCELPGRRRGPYNCALVQYAKPETEIRQLIETGALTGSAFSILLQVLLQVEILSVPLGRGFNSSRIALEDGAVVEFPDEVRGMYPSDGRVIQWNQRLADRVRRLPASVECAPDSGHGVSPCSDRYGALAKRWAELSCCVCALGTDRRFGDSHPFGPVWPIVAVVLE